jgi:NADH-quinone oxidoreductase subunit A
MNASLSPYLTFALWFGCIMGFVAITLLMNAALGPEPKPMAVKLEPFECGATPVDALNVKALPIK